MCVCVGVEDVLQRALNWILNLKRTSHTPTTLVLCLCHPPSSVARSSPTHNPHRFCSSSMSPQCVFFSLPQSHPLLMRKCESSNLRINYAKFVPYAIAMGYATWLPNILRNPKKWSVVWSELKNNLYKEMICKKTYGQLSISITVFILSLYLFVFSLLFNMCCCPTQLNPLNNPHHIIMHCLDTPRESVFQVELLCW